METQDEPLGETAIACVQCRRSKRRCDKQRPSCNICVRKEVDCSYPARRRPKRAALATHTSLSPELQSRSSEQKSPHLRLPSTLSDNTNVNAVYFISPRLFLQTQLELPRPTSLVSNEVSFLLADNSYHSTSSFFFTTIHRWLPIVSKRVFYNNLLSPLAQRRTELSLLVLSMKLCCTSPSGDEGEGAVKTDLYHTVKRLHHDISAGFLSISVLQAGILIALYELSQAIYPAADLTVGACARYGLALGVGNFTSASTAGSRPLSFDEIEERRRVWWAVLLLDRFLCLSNPARPLSTDDPTFDTYLPVDDAAWDDCTAIPGDAVQISTGFTLEMGSFARVAQATFLVSQALQSMKLTATEGDISAQLRRTLLALVHTLDNESIVRRLEFCAPSSLSFSTIFILQEHALREGRSDATDESAWSTLQALWSETRTAIDRLSSAAVSYMATYAEISHASDTISLFLMHVMYQAAYFLLNLTHGTLEGANWENIEKIRVLLRSIGVRWRLAGVYLNILEAQELRMSWKSIEVQDASFRS